MILYIDDWIFNITLHVIIIKAKCQRRSISKGHHQHHMKKMKWFHITKTTPKLISTMGCQRTIFLNIWIWTANIAL